jgi:hypothetical protein
MSRYPSTANTPTTPTYANGFTVKLVDPNSLGYIDGYAISTSIISITCAIVSYAEPKLQNIYLLGAAGAVTIKGYFADINGDITGVSFSTTIPAAGSTPWSFNNVSNGIPTNAQFARVNLSNNVYQVSANSSTPLTDFQNNTTNYPVTIAIKSGYNTFGRAGN